jgi:hypothetical protein
VSSFGHGSYASSLGHKRRRWAISVVVGPYASSLGRMHHHCAARVVIGPYGASLGRTCRRLHRVGNRSSTRGCPTWDVVRGLPHRRRGRFVHLSYGVELKGISGEVMEGRRAKTSHDKCRGSFRDAPAGPPISWVPPGSCFPLSIPRSRSKPSPHPSEEGRGTWWGGVRGLKDGGWGAR